MDKIGVVGAGTMGCGIVQVFLEHGYSVILNDLDDIIITKGIAVISKNIDRSIERGLVNAEQKNSFLESLTYSKEIKDLNECLLVIEAVRENLDVKKGIFKKLDDICMSDAILASNTSSMSITELSNATKRQDKVIGMHFFNPAPVMRLVEIIKGLGTSAETYEKVNSLVLAIGKTPIKVEEAPGFIVNRLLIPMINEAIGVFADNVASANEIDNAMKLGANHPIGPLALADMIGLDVVLAIMENLQCELGEDKYRPHPLLRKMVRAGITGKKTKHGFYKY